MLKGKSVTEKSRARRTTPSMFKPALAQSDIASRQFKYKRLLKQHSDPHFGGAGAECEAIIVIDQLDLIQSFNPAAERIFGFSAAEVIGRDVKHLLLAPSQADHADEFAARRDTGLRKLVGDGREIAGKHENGSTMRLEMSIAEWRDIDGRSRATCFVHDVRSRKSPAPKLQFAGEAAEPARLDAEGANGAFDRKGVLKEYSDRYFAVVDTAVDAIIVADRFGVVESFNRAAEEIFGYSATEVIGKNVKLLVPEFDQAGHDGCLAATRETGERKIIGIGREVLGKRKDGSTAPLELSVAEWRDSDGRQCVDFR